ncbi:MAG: ATP-binding protein [Candidatus Binatia bacterium]
MIIKQLQAENVLKYAALHLTNLPTRGLIGISGSNESGKTSIAEIICLALFGRTFALPPQELAKCIKWGEFHGSVKLEFTDKDGRLYAIVRELDGDGNHSARLTRSDNATLIARGAQAVSQAVTNLSGWNYEQFVASLYLAQRSITFPNALTGTIKTLAGVELLEIIAAELAQDVRDAQSAITESHIQLDDTKTQLQGLGALDEQLSSLQNERQTQAAEMKKTEAESARLQSASDTLRDAAARVTNCVEQFVRAGLLTTLAQWQTHAAQLDGALAFSDNACSMLQQNDDGVPTRELHVWLDDFRTRLRAFMGVNEVAKSYCARQSQLLHGAPDTPDESSSPSSLPQQEVSLNTQLQSTLNSRSRARAGFWLTLLATGASGGIWGALTFARDSQPSQWLVSTLGEQVFSYLPFLSLAAGLFGLLCLLLLLRVVVLSSRTSSRRQALANIRAQTESVRQQLQLLEPVPELPLPTAMETWKQAQDPQISAAVLSFIEGPGAPLVQANVFTESMTQLQTALTVGLGRLRSVQERLGAKLQGVSHEMEKHQLEMRRIDQAIAAEQARREKIESVTQQQHALQQKIDEQQRQTAMRSTADQLLSGCHSRLYARFNLELQHIVSKVLPLLTEGRYQSVLVTKDAQLQLLSPTKGDFVGMDEISGGSYNQVWLAVRLALSHALISATDGGPQFLILDEPFVFFDDTRTRLTLDLLSHLSDDIAQVWVINPRFDEDLNFALQLRCARESDTLIVAGE